MNSDTVKALALQYWKYDQCSPLVALEDSNRDVACIHRHYLVVTEVKVSVADLRRDLDKSTHCWIRRLLKLPVEESRWGLAATDHAGDSYEPTYLANVVQIRQFYFAVPEDIQGKSLAVIEKLFPYAGLLSARFKKKTDSYRYGEIDLVKTAQLLPVEKASKHEVLEMVKAQSRTLTRLALKLGRDKSQNMPEEK
jgi:hypothetical protein